MHGLDLCMHSESAQTGMQRTRCSIANLTVLLNKPRLFILALHVL